MSLDWVKMNIMEPDWYEAHPPQGPVQLNMNWEEDEWLLCRDKDVIFRTGTGDIEAAQIAAEKWLISELR